ncbi:MAG TPA: phage holin family protein [Candidatus Saccharibacteria bacterium]|nr:phage holin family protein [Candidatus Saccharibacteria bacterium]HMR38701.1 phage holin family protein [Candidatus Saccharibacteria bacterium]
MKSQLQQFAFRWLLNSLGLWLAVRLFGTGYAETPESLLTFLLVGLVLSIVNSLLKPLIIILALPALLLTLGVFMLIINGFLVYITFKIAPGVEMTFWHSVIAGVVISLVNYTVSSFVESQSNNKEDI